MFDSFCRNRLVFLLFALGAAITSPVFPGEDTQQNAHIERQAAPPAGQAAPSTDPPATRSETLPDHIQTLRQELDTLSAVFSDPEGPKGAVEERLDRLIAHLEGLEPSTRGAALEKLEYKRRSLLRQAQQLRAGGRPSQKPSRVLRSDSDPKRWLASSCDRAEFAELGQRLHGSRNATGWMRFQAPHAGEFTVTTIGSRGDTQLEVYRSCDGELVAADDDTRGLFAVAAFEALAGESFWIRGEVKGEKLKAAVTTGASISGRVSDSSGEAIPHVDVDLYRAGSGNIGRQRSDGDGSYRFSGLEPGIYFIWSSSSQWLDSAYEDVVCGYSCDVDDATPITINSETDITGIDLTLFGGASVSGRVTLEASSEPLPDVQVTVFDALGRSMDDAWTDDVGRYLMQGLPAGEVRLGAEHSETTDMMWPSFPCDETCDPLSGETITLELDQTVRDIDFRLELLGSIDVDVTDAITGAPVDYPGLEVFDASGDRVGAEYGSPLRVGGLATGIYFVVVRSNYHLDSLWQGPSCEWNCNPLEGTPVEVVEGETVRLSIGLQPNGALSGRVIDLASREGIPDTRIHIYTSDGAQSVGYPRTDQDGWFRTDALPPADYRISASPQLYQAEAWDDHPCPEDGCHLIGDIITVSPGETVSGIQFELQKLGAIQGTITSSTTGEPLPGVEIEAFDQDGESDYRWRTYSDDDGSYLIEELTPGQYFLVASLDGYDSQLYDNLPFSNGTDPLSGKAVQVALATVEDEINFSLDRQPWVAGRVTSRQSGLALENVNVTVYDSEGNRVKGGYTAADGTYEINGLNPGTYYLAASEASSYYDSLQYDHLAVLWDGQVCFRGIGEGCSALQGNPVHVGLAGATADFQLPFGGQIQGNISASVPWMSGDVWIYDCRGALLGQVEIELEGDTFAFVARGLETGTYFAHTWMDFTLDNLLWHGLPCPGYFAPECNPTSGTPIHVQRGFVTEGVNFAPQERGSILVRVQAEDGITSPGDGGRVLLFDARGEELDSVYPDLGEVAQFEALPSGRYYLGTQFDAWIDTIFGGDICEPGPCDPTSGTPISVVNGQIVGPIEITLQAGPGFRIELQSDTGELLEGAIVDIFSAGGHHYGALIAGPTGVIEAAWPPGNYYLATDNGHGLVDEVWEDVACPEGPAYMELCDPLQGREIVLEDGQPLTRVHFQLDQQPIIFGDGFETGSTESWSEVHGD